MATISNSLGDLSKTAPLNLYRAHPTRAAPDDAPYRLPPVQDGNLMVIELRGYRLIAEALLMNSFWMGQRQPVIAASLYPDQASHGHLLIVDATQVVCDLGLSVLDMLAADSADLAIFRACPDSSLLEWAQGLIYLRNEGIPIDRAAARMALRRIRQVSESVLCIHSR